MYDELDSISPDHGQVTKACLKRERYDRWGIHNLLSLQRALELEQRHNFKDPSVQHFGGSLFKQLNDEALFKELPAPVPKHFKQTTTWSKISHLEICIIWKLLTIIGLLHYPMVWNTVVS